MSAAAKIKSTDVERLRWVDICERHPSEWVGLVDVELAPDGSIASGRVAGHARSMKHLLGQLDTPAPDTVLKHTAGRPLFTPRVEMTDEIRDLIRARR